MEDRMQKVLIMIDSFKGTLDSKDLGKTMKNIFSNHQIKADYVSIRMVERVFTMP